MSTLTVFTCTYNRSHTLERLYQSLTRQTSKDFNWLIIDDGSTDKTKELVLEFQQQKNDFKIRYCYKDNGGLYTGYNKAIELMNTELCVCIDSDDYMPDNAVEIILSFWKTHGNEEYAGIVGLDFYMNGGPIGGFFPEGLKSSFITNLTKYHKGDVKMVHRVELLKKVAPMPGAPNEKFANPIYLFLKVDMYLPMLIINKNLCFVDYQDANNSMSKNIFYQYKQSPNSFAQLRLLALQNKRTSYLNKIKNTIHYISSCIFARKYRQILLSPMRCETILLFPLGLALNIFIRYKVYSNKNHYR